MIKLKDLINESDLGYTTKKGKTIKVVHKTSGKELVVVDTPPVRKKYKRLGFDVVGETVTEAKKYKLGDQWSKDFDYEGILNWGMRAELRMSEQELLALFKSYEDVNYHKASAPLWDALVALKKDDKSKAKSLLKKFNALSKREFG